MKKILVFSDCHYDSKAVDLLMGKIDYFDYVYFCGDGIARLDLYQYAYPNKIEAVRGNCDPSFDSHPLELTTTVEGVTIFLTHGHRYLVKSGLSELETQALKHNASLVIYGHTHIQSKTEKDGIIYLNPGCSGSLNGIEYAEIWVSEKNIQIMLRKLY